MRFHPATVGALTALSVVLTAQAPAPEPSPTSLPVIGRTHSKGFCTTVRDGIAPAVLGLMQNDDLIASSRATLLKAGHDASVKPNKGFEPAAIELDRISLARVADSMAHNLDTVRRTLSDSKRFPRTAVTDDDRRALSLKAQLQAAVDRQNEDYNHLNGVLEIVEMRQMRMEALAATGGSVEPVGLNSAPVDDFPDTSSSQPDSGTLALGGTGHVAQRKIIGRTIWDQLAADVEIQQVRIARAEQTLTPAVVAAATACRGEDASPAPRSTP